MDSGASSHLTNLRGNVFNVRPSEVHVFFADDVTSRGDCKRIALHNDNRKYSDNNQNCLVFCTLPDAQTSYRTDILLMKLVIVAQSQRRAELS